MDSTDLLTEFEGKVARTPLFKITITVFVCLFITHAALFQVSWFKNLSYGLLNLLKMIFLFLLVFAYPIFGGWAFFRIKKIGWFICAHYAVTSFFVSCYFLVDNGGLLTGSSVLLSLMEVILIFQTPLVKFFDVSHKLIFAVLVTTIAAPFALVGILFVLYSLQN